jgi:hypothetical protein
MIAVHRQHREIGGWLAVLSPGDSDAVPECRRNGSFVLIFVGPPPMKPLTVPVISDSVR